MRSNRALIVGALSCAIGGYAHGQIFYNNFLAGDTSTTNGYAFEGGGTLSYFEQGFSFTSGATGQLAKLTLSVFYVTGTNSATMTLWSDSAGLPGSALGSWTLNNLPSNGSGTATTTSFTGGPPLSSGTTYWLSVSVPVNSESTWDQTSAGTIGPRVFRSSSSSAFSNVGNGVQGGMRLEAVPEPTSLAALSLGALLVLKRLRNNA